MENYLLFDKKPQVEIKEEDMQTNGIVNSVLIIFADSLLKKIQIRTKNKRIKIMMKQ